MTPSPDVDEIASALIDGALGPDEAAAARRDPAVMARAAEMQAAREAVRRVAPPDPTRRDAAITAALAAASGRAVPGYDVSGDPGASGGLDAPVGGPAGRPGAVTPPHPIPDTDTDPRPAGPAGRPAGGAVVPMGPSRRRKWTDPRWLGAAAAVALLLAVGGVLATGSADSDDSDSATAALDSSAPSTTGGESAPQDGGAGTGGGSAESGGDSTTAAPEQAPGLAPDRSGGTTARTGVDLGNVGSAGELADRAGHALAGARTEANAEEGSPPAGGNESSDSGSGPLTASGACPDPLASTGAGPLVLQGRATLAGRPVDVWVHDDGSSQRMVAVAADGSCDVVADRPVPG